MDSLTIRLSAPRGFCAGVDRAIQIVEEALRKWGPPVYVRHEIVHNAHVVDGLRAKGAIFVEELSECPDDRPVIFSAHGVPKSVPAEASTREMIYVDATCPLVSKVHVEAQKHFDSQRDILLIGHAGHPEVVGTMGQLPEGSIRLIETPEDAAKIDVKDPDNLAFVTQTTLSVDDTAEMIDVLRQRFPTISAPHKEDICYATTNRQEAVKAMAEGADLVLVIGAENSSNSKRLVDVALRSGAKDARLVASVDFVDWSWFEGVSTLGITAGASAPEILVEDLIDACRARYDVTLDEIRVTDENVTFKLPRVLADT
ncbi:4-hydroxy-3-methylbut-2-enyl diphosphate reductase [Ponticaulis sp.]|uniref:4-hydroxy-3-methylbut-2-enyl diphosphate reductase n=1 Tax=Ponticaulis sp. TaxID=2020902 RepID=UPI000B6EDC0D|nr:4-hydroxy-3-methylbut-2-enyl diphosphate reductase [Ponticaulis sp.]MAI90818.1 4-hydroxy-3-methylbut-2-enyl diphosphate reductase [Ponticaulis sp.]OUX98793.1 MAG: 4-hydroxy-3-methylbut-2-enyl diphosphate reductase [Hyphomonadaceae bacterium TMED5]|tara:strand:+ start:9131 stop:10072 length:942 start_codon:yes stop_codon:yes gene_type:complete